jgi:hypothetical protein
VGINAVQRMVARVGDDSHNRTDDDDDDYDRVSPCSLSTTDDVIEHSGYCLRPLLRGAGSPVVETACVQCHKSDWCEGQYANFGAVLEHKNEYVFACIGAAVVASWLLETS